MQKQILLFIEKIFEGKESLNIKQFTEIIEKVSSEMLLTIMTLIQERLPSSENFFRFQKNYDKLATEGGAGKSPKNNAT